MKSINENQIELGGILNHDLLDESTVDKVSNQFKIIKEYPLNAPFSYAKILWDEKNSNFQYFVDEIKLNFDEERIYKDLYTFVEESLDSLETTKERNFDTHLNDVIKKHEGFFTSNPIASMEKVKYFLKRDIMGYGEIDALMHDPNIEDISCSGPQNPLYVWHRNYDSMSSNISFESHQILNSFITRIVFKAGKHVSTAHPISDLAITGNHRISVLYQKEITPKGTSFTIRKFKEDPYTIIDLIDFGTIDIETAAYLWMMIEAKMSIMIIGSTGSGKTTVLNAIAGLVSENDKLFSVEDVAEINLPHDNWFSLISRSGYGSNDEGEIGLYELIKSGVRHRPDYIIVGEIRGSEAYVMFQAMATGHGGLCTMHADSFDSASKRLQQKPMSIPPAYLSLMNSALVIKRVKDKVTGQSMRRAISVEEISSNSVPNSVTIWNPKSDYFEHSFNSSKNLKKISEQTGDEFEDILKEHHKRTKILKWMSANSIREHKKVTEMIRKYYNDPKSVLKKINYGDDG
ncbi:MAG: type II/IV secretion system ATPase subunit [Nitrosopumilus sp.]|nr:type II/IV secretion system ATPase subunit [Nitrosopumilus sp.]MDH3385701.1 type II/IV secretion system ATPase subunit [Nitrosopumilus sp.]